MIDQIELPPPLADDLRAVERIVLDRMRSQPAVLGVVQPQLLDGGEPRWRAALVLLTAALGEYRSERTLHAAAAAELIYAATHTHDELVDAAARRRGTVEAEGAWDHGVALMVGDYLFALAAGEMALAPDSRVIGFYSRAVMAICEAELSPVTQIEPLDEARAAYYRAIGGRSAALFAAACRAGAACGKLDERALTILAEFGHELGLAYQLAADARNAAAAVARGVLTLPIIFAAAHSDSHRLRAALDSADPAEHAWAQGEVERLGVAATYNEARTAATRTAALLEAYPASPARHALLALAAKSIAG